MKPLVIFSALLLSADPLFSQSNVAMGQEFAELAAHGGLSGKGFAAFQTYSSGNVDGSQFFLTDWQNGEVVTTHKETFSIGLQFIYDKVRQELFVRKSDSSLVLLTNKDEVESFTLMDGEKRYYFVNSKLFTDNKPEVFYQVLVYDSSKISLFKYIKTIFVKADMTDMMKQRQGNVYDAFVDRNIYYMVKDHSALTPVQLKTKNIRKAFESLKIPVDSYLKEHWEYTTTEEYLIEMVKQLNH